MIEIQCTSCHTRYRIDERVLPEDTPTFKCSRCGHVFNADPLPAKTRAPAAQVAETDSKAAPMPQSARVRSSAPQSSVEPRTVKREPVAPMRVVDFEPEPPIRPGEHSISEPDASDSVTERELGSDHPLNRSFGDREKADTGENFKFDFSNESREINDPEHEDELAAPDHDDDRWEVGDAPELDPEPKRPAPTLHAPASIEASESSPRPAPASTYRVAAALKVARPRPHSPQAAKAADFELGHRADDADDLPMLGKSYSSGYFVAMFFIVAIAFVAASSLIFAEPIASARLLSAAPEIGAYFARPIVPAMLVAIHDVHSEYRTLKGGQVALVITGTAQNVGASPLHLVQIDAELLGAGTRALSRLDVYCGNELSAKMLGEMTPREIEFSQALSPQKTFAIESSGAAPFLMVFVNPPVGAGNVRLSVSKAITADSPEPVGGAAARRS